MTARQYVDRRANNGGQNKVPDEDLHRSRTVCFSDREWALIEAARMVDGYPRRTTFIRDIVLFEASKITQQKGGT